MNRKPFFISIVFLAWSMTGCVMDDELDGTWPEDLQQGDDLAKEDLAKEDVQDDEAGQSVEPVEKTYISDLGSQWGGRITYGDTTNLGSSFSPSCAYSNNTPDAVYTWTAPFSGTFVFMTPFSKFDTILEVRPFNNPSQSLGCNDDAAGSLQSSVTVSLSAGQTVYVIVDGFGSHKGFYYLEIYRVVPFSSGWTGWLDRDDPSGLGDYETLTDFINAGQTCANPIGIECQTTSGVPAGSTGEVVWCKGLEGGYCRNNEQPDGYCLDYRVRFYCP